MADRTPLQPWRQPGWLDQASVWIEHTLKARGIQLTGPIDQFHQAPWSTVLRVPTSEGSVYFKAPSSDLIYETALTQVLSQWRPDCILPLLAVDLERGWMLLPDGGTRLRDLIRAERSSRPWETILPVYAGLQMDMVPYCEDLLALGVPDLRLAVLPSQFEQLLDDEEVLGIDQHDRLTRDEAKRLRELVPDVTATCHELAQFHIPESLAHQDLQDGNIFVRDGHPIFFDWDSCITHPFFSLRVVVVSVEVSLDLKERSAPVASLRDAYLEPWTRRVARADLFRAFDVARRLWMVADAIAWYRLLVGLQGAERDEYAYTVTSLLKEFLDANAVPALPRTTFGSGTAL